MAKNKQNKPSQPETKEVKALEMDAFKKMVDNRHLEQLEQFAENMEEAVKPLAEADREAGAAYILEVLEARKADVAKQEDKNETKAKVQPKAEKADVAKQERELAETRAKLVASLDVNAYSGRDELEAAAAKLNVPQEKLDAVTSREELWHVVKNAMLDATQVKAVEESVEGGSLMKCTVKHNGVWYKKGVRYELDKATYELFRSKYFI